MTFRYLLTLSLALLLTANVHGQSKRRSRKDDKPSSVDKPAIVKIETIQSKDSHITGFLSTEFQAFQGMDSKTIMHRAFSETTFNKYGGVEVIVNGKSPVFTSAKRDSKLAVNITVDGKELPVTMAATTFKRIDGFSQPFQFVIDVSDLRGAKEIKMKIGETTVIPSTEFKSAVEQMIAAIDKAVGNKPPPANEKYTKSKEKKKSSKSR